jgi:hypothetical protein
MKGQGIPTLTQELLIQRAIWTELLGYYVDNFQRHFVSVTLIRRVQLMSLTIRSYLRMWEREDSAQ